MSTEEDKWNLDRLPTKWERIYGSIFAILIFVLMSFFLYVSSLMLIEKSYTNNILATFSVAALLFIGSCYLLVRVVFRKSRKPSLKTILITGYVIGVAISLLLVVSLFGFENSIYLAGIGFTGLAGSSLIIKNGNRRGKS